MSYGLFYYVNQFIYFDFYKDFKLKDVLRNDNLIQTDHK
jgi:hypothetical protein